MKFLKYSFLYINTENEFSHVYFSGPKQKKIFFKNTYMHDFAFI